MRLVLTFSLILPALADPVTLFLTENASDNLITIQATVNDFLSDTAETIYTGQIEAEIDLPGRNAGHARLAQWSPNP
jgi:hypothetical protein